jgi:hypothetical protein
METSQLNKIFEKESCLSPETITHYIDGTADKEARHKMEKHLIDCELCSLALEGTIAIPITNTDMNDIYEKIDQKITTSGKKVRSRGKQFLYTSIIALLALGIYYFISNRGRITIPKTALYKPIPDNPIVKKEFSINEINAIADKKPETKLSAPLGAPTITKAENVDNMKRKELFLQPLSSTPPTDQLPIQSVPSSDEIIYLHNCKVANARKLYYKSSVEVNILRDVPAPNEKRYSSSDISPDEKAISAISLLDKGLDYFSTGSYSRAYDELQALVENNNKDVNALFYSGLCQFHLGNMKGAKARFSKLLADNNFGEEASWYYSLSLLNEGNSAEAVTKLKAIVDANGFYAGEAKKKLEEIK